jgi:hypothetical protein
MKKCLPAFLLIVLLSAFAQVSAQPAPAMAPPNALLIIREEIKPGMMGVHNRHSAEFTSVFSELQTPNHRIAMVPVAGNENEVIYITPLESFAELETMNRATDSKLESATGMTRAKLDRLDKEGPVLHAAMRDMLAIYRPELSFNPGVNIAQMRYFSITTTRVKPGYDAQFVDYIQKILNVARRDAKVNLHTAVFQVISGAQAGMYISFRPMKSLAEMDEAIPRKVRAAMGDDMKKDADKAVRETIMSQDASIYAFAPRMSYVGKEMAAVDPAFWNPKPITAAEPRPRRRPNHHRPAVK